MDTSPIFWRGRRVLLTGHSGFKGSWMAIWLSQMGAQVTGVSLPPVTSPNLFTLANINKMVDGHFLDIRDADKIKNLVKKVRPEIVIHMAAQALVRAGYKDPLGTFSTNVIGTANILDALRDISSVKVVVAITTDKVYKNLEQIYPYRETDQLGGRDPYSASKSASEAVISCYRNSYLESQGVAVASARAGNVIGGGDWSEDRLIPDAVRAWGSNSTLEIRRPNAIRPWQHVLEPINGYLVLAEKLYLDRSLSGAYNFGPKTHEASTVRNVIEIAAQVYGFGKVLWGSDDGPHEAGLLSLEIAKSKDFLGITPKWNLNEAVERTMKWYQEYGDGVDATSLCTRDISQFLALRGLS